jgi:Uma2 family endonuclease
MEERDWILYPPRTMMEVFKCLPEGTWVEIIEGALHIKPAMFVTDHDVRSSLGFALNDFITEQKLSGELFFNHFDVYLDENSNVVLPEISFSLDEIVKEDAIHGSPQLTIDITRDDEFIRRQNLKTAVYQKFSIKEFWFVNSDSKECKGFYLQHGIYSPLETGFGKLKSVILNHEFTF